MLKSKKIAITGGVASGKSTVCQFFQELGAYVVSADAIVHELLSPKTNLGQQVLQLFGPELLQNGKINRRILAEKVFKNPDQLKALEALLHPAVLRKVDELYEKEKKLRQQRLFIVEIPLLYEIQAEDSYDAVIAILTDEEIAKNRSSKTGLQPSEYEKRMNRQLKPSEKAKRAHYILTNNGSLEELHEKVIKLNSILKEN